ncbi:MarR family winged helix-turn-helix transcriptional regulator [Streptomyces mirabilis]|uniref:MarR family winged helix-turn-helix transcriptional regulator n=1 Tax=Streptomyces mirabilis TaxID=68239 RepID=UPI0036923951
MSRGASPVRSAKTGLARGVAGSVSPRWSRARICSPLAVSAGSTSAFALMEVGSLLQHAVDQQLRDEGGLSYTQSQILAVLGQAPEGQLRMTDIADRLVHSRSGLTYQVAQLAKAGLVARAPSADDERSVNVTAPPGQGAPRPSDASATYWAGSAPPCARPHPARRPPVASPRHSATTDPRSHRPPAGRPATRGAVAVRRKPVAHARIEQRLPSPAHV